MANTLTGLIPTIYTARDIVARELIGFIPNVSLDASAAQAAKDQTVRSPIAPQNTLEDIVPGNDPADSGDQTIDYTDVTISKSKAYPIRWTGEEQLSVSEYGQVNTILQDQFTQGFRTLANAVEEDLAALYVSASRAHGTAGTTPFATADNHTDFAGANRILDDNGAPQSDRAMVVGSAAREKLEGVQSSLFKVNEAGDAGALLRDRQMRGLHGFTMGFSGQILSHTKGAGAGYDLNGAEAVGQTTLTLDGGTVNTTGIKAGDVVTVAGDSNKYIVNTGLTNATGDIVIGDPGLLEAGADTAELTIGNNYVANMFFHRSALVLAARSPAMPEGGDEADDVITVQDPISGLTFQVAMYRQYRRIKYEIGLAWGVAAPNKKYLGLLLG